MRRLSRPVVCLLSGLALALAGLAVPASAGEGVDYRLELDTGGHRGVIRALAFSGDGGLLFSASDDRTVRVWDLAVGRSIATLRGQIGDGEEGMVFALAASPDGAQVASAGFLAPVGATEGFGDIRVHDRRSGRLTHLIEGRPLPVFALAYAPERDELAAAGQGGDVHRWRAPFSGAPEPLQALDADARRIDGLAWALSGTRLIATTADFGLRLWDAASGKPIAPPDAEALWDADLVSLAVSADGTRFAIAGAAGLVQVRDARDGSLLAELPPQPFRPDALAFLDGDRALFVGCGYGCLPGMGSRVFDWQAGAELAFYRGLDGLTTAAVALNGPLAIAGGWRHEIHLWQPGTAAPAQLLAGEGAPVFSVALQPAGEAIAWGTTHPCPERVACPERMGALAHALPLPAGERRLSPPGPLAPEAAGWRRALHKAEPFALRALPDARFETGVLEITGPAGPRAIAKSGGTDGWYHSAFSLLPEAGQIVTGGGNGFLGLHRLSDLALTQVFEGHTADVLALAASESAGRLLTGSADQTLRLWNLDTGAPIASLFVAGDEWIVWTPQGYYHASPGGDRLIGWHVNQGRDREGRLMRAYQLKRHLHSPEIVERALRTGDAAGAARALRGRDDTLQALLARPAPDFELRLVEDAPPEPGFALVEITGGLPPPAPPDAPPPSPGARPGFSLLVNDRRVPAEPVPGAPAGAQRFRVPVEEGANDILATLEDDAGYITTRGASAVGAQRTAALRGRLRVAVVGIDRYPHLPTACGGRTCDLAFPGVDAAAFLRTLADHSAPLFAGFEALALLHPEAAAPGGRLHPALDGLIDPAAVIAPEARAITFELIDFLDGADDPADTTVIFVAGHGITLGEDYFLIPTDGRQRDAERWQMGSLVDWRAITAALERAQGRRILVLDTCHAGAAFGAVNQRLEKDAADARVSVFAATGPTEPAAETARLGHGIFTHAIVEGLRGRAPRTEEGVFALGLAEFVSHEVIRLSAGTQEPMFHFPQMRNFLMARP